MSLIKPEFTEQTTVPDSLFRFDVRDSKLEKTLFGRTHDYFKMFELLFILHSSIENLESLKIPKFSKPLKSWKPSKEDTVNEYDGKLSKIIPSLLGLSEIDIEKSLLRSKNIE